MEMNHQPLAHCVEWYAGKYDTPYSCLWSGSGCAQEDGILYRGDLLLDELLPHDITAQAQAEYSEQPIVHSEREVVV